MNLFKRLKGIWRDYLQLINKALAFKNKGDFYFEFLWLRYLLTSRKSVWKSRSWLGKSREWEERWTIEETSFSGKTSQKFWIKPLFIYFELNGRMAAYKLSLKNEGGKIIFWIGPWTGVNLALEVEVQGEKGTAERRGERRMAAKKVLKERSFSRL